MENIFVNYFVPGSMWLTGICAVLAIFVPIVISITDDPKSLIKGLIGVLSLGIVFLISYSVSGSEVSAKYIKYDVLTKGLSQSIGGVLTMTYALLGIAIIGIIFTEVSKILK